LKDRKGHPYIQSKRRLENGVVCDLCELHKPDILSCEACNLDICRECSESSKFKKFKLAPCKEIKGLYLCEDPQDEYKDLEVRIMICSDG
jgi:hypothetical protein